MSKNKKEMQPHWRPNFNIPATLPDIKVIRTDFIVNFISVALAFAVSFYVVQREYRIHSLNETLDAMRQRIRTEEPEDKLNLAKSERFRKAAGHIIELEKFYETPVLAHSFLAKLSDLRPEGLVFNMLVVAEGTEKKGSKEYVKHSIRISGRVKDPLLLEDFKTTLQTSDLLDLPDYEPEINELLLSREAKTGIFPYRLTIDLRPDNVAGAGKKGGKG